MVICLDSTVIIDFLKGRKEAVEVVKKYKEDNSLVVTEISVFEIFLGIYLKKLIDNNELTKVREFFKSIEVLPFDNLSGEIASKIYSSLSKKGELIEQNDIFIASIMNKNGCKKIITRNKKHFSRIDGLKVLDY
jgi:tRNA(fMet)-specific endonuclease VapC